MDKLNISPVLKWAGGKRQLISEIEKRLPKNINNYYEPFLGGGAIAFYLQQKPCFLNDISSELINVYTQIKENPDALILELDKLEAEHAKNPEEHYYYIRELDRDADFNELNDTYKAARTIYLNKSCFNGLYRVNKKGHFNVPFNKKLIVKTYDRNNILNISQFLNDKNVHLSCGDFEEVCKTAKAGDFIFFDPPYDLLKTDTFDSYTKDGFGVEGQKRLAKLFVELDKKGCKLMLTNHNTPLINELYKDFNIDLVSVKRMINSDANNRIGQETIIYNYNLEGQQMKQEFDALMDNLKISVADYKYYVDFDKVKTNVDKFKIELNILNSLIGSKDIENDFDTIITRYPETIKVLPLLLAVRKNEISFIDGKEITIKFNGNETNETYNKFMKETGLFNLLQEKQIKSLEDYVTGVEVGLDTNARKNRTGTAMENIVESFIKEIPNVVYHKEMKKQEIMSTYNIDLNALILDENPEKDAEKKFDFVVKTTDNIYLIETNFYSGGGSKLNETARSFKSLANDINKIDNVYFVWITDGVGWKTARNNLRETYGIMDHIYTLTDLENGVLKDVFK